MRRDWSYSSGGKTEDSVGRACVGAPGDDATAHRTWDHGRRSSSSSSSRNALPRCLGSVGSATPAMHRITAWGQWAVQPLQRIASLPDGSWQCNCCNALPHCLGVVGSATPAMHRLTAWGAVGSATPAMHCITAWGQWAVQLLQCTASLHAYSGQCNSCNALPHCLRAVGRSTIAMHCLPAGGQWAVELLQCLASLP